MVNSTVSNIITMLDSLARPSQTSTQDSGIIYSNVYSQNLRIEIELYNRLRVTIGLQCS